MPKTVTRKRGRPPKAAPPIVVVSNLHDQGWSREDKLFAALIVIGVVAILTIAMWRMSR